MPLRPDDPMFEGSLRNVIRDEIGNLPVLIRQLQGAQKDGELLGFARQSAAVTSFYTNSSATPADVDATNLAVTFTVPRSGQVIVRLNGFASGAAQYWGVRQGSSDVSDYHVEVLGGAGVTRTFLIDGLSSGDSVTLKWGWASPTAVNTFLNYGSTYGELFMEVLSA